MIEELDFIYMPSRDVAADLWFYSEVLDGQVVFAIEAFGARVAEVRVGEGPHLLLADHLHGEAPVLVHRVADLEASLAALARRGWADEGRFEIPPGPVASLRSPGGQRLAFYELTRPEVYRRFAGRLDFEPVPPTSARR
jgi:hypothetical protein